MINYHNNPHVHTVVVDAQHSLASQFGGVAVPAVHVFKRDSPHAPSYSSSETFDFEKIQAEVDKFVEHLQGDVQNQARDICLRPTSSDLGCPTKPECPGRDRNDTQLATI